MDFNSLLNLGATYLSYESAKDAAEASAKGATDAAKATTDATDKEIDFSKWLYNQQTELQKPYYNTGTSALPMLQARAGIRPQATKPQLQRIPRYSTEQAANINNVYDYVSNLYIDGLGREGNASDINKWVGKIADGTYNKSSVISAFQDEAKANGINYDANKLNQIQNAIKVENSLLSTNTRNPNYLNQYQSRMSEGDGNNGGDFQTSTMNPNSHFGRINFSDIKSFNKEWGSNIAKAAGMINPALGLVLGATSYAVDKFGGNDNSADAEIGGVSTKGSFSQMERDMGLNNVDYSGDGNDNGGDNGESGAGSGTADGGAEAGGSFSCFVAGSIVKTVKDNKIINKKIEDVQIGEMLLGQNASLNEVIEFDRPKANGRKIYKINDSDFFVTEEHPFLTSQGWKSINPEMTKEYDTEMYYKENMDKNTSLVVGDTMIKIDGEEEILTIESKEVAKETPLYNFKLNGNHTYVVDNFIVHNKF